jgi:hypothetical protein
LFERSLKFLLLFSNLDDLCVSNTFVHCWKK